MKFYSLLIIQVLSVGLFPAQDLILNDGIYFEKPLYRDTSMHKYSIDNISYKVNSVFIYDYFFLDKEGRKYKFLYSQNESSVDNPLNLVPLNNITDDVIEKIKIEVDDNLKTFARGDSNYTQTIFSLSYLKKNGKRSDTTCETFKKTHPKLEIGCGDEFSGVVDNAKNLWIHPPRSFAFKILQLNPFPFYYLDETVKTWSWNVTVGGFYLDPRWIDQKEKITVFFNYKRLPNEAIETPFGKLKCKVTDGIGKADLKNGILETRLKSFYDPKYGFVRLEYTNINGTKIVIQLVDIK